MRVIKFRAWDKAQQKMLDWDAIHSTSIPYLQEREYEVMQFTGLLDKNGTEIYEGDILENGSVMRIVRGAYVPVRFVAAWGCDVYRDEDCAVEAQVSGFIIRDYLAEDLSVIGNIYQNPDLSTGLSTVEA